MAISGRKDSKRIRALQDLEEAWALLGQAAKKGVRATQALLRIEEAREKVEKAALAATPTTLKAEESDTGKPKTLRDGLPADIRRAIQREAEHLQRLAARVKAIPVTKDQRVLASRRRRTREDT